MRPPRLVNNSIHRQREVITFLGLACLTAICGCVYPSSPAYDSHSIPLPTGAPSELVKGEKAVQEPEVQRGMAAVNPTENRPVTDMANGVKLFERGQFAAAQQFFTEFV